MGKIVAITGNVCAGKDTLRRMLQQEGFEYILPTTTRNPERDEQPEVDMNFVTKTVYERLVLDDTFIAEDSYTDDYGNDISYGWWRMDFDLTKPTPSNAVRLVILPVDILTNLIKTGRVIDGVIALRCNAVASIYRIAHRSNNTLDLENVRYIGDHDARWRTYEDQLQVAATEKKIPLITYWTDTLKEPLDTETVIKDLMARKLMDGGKR